VKIIVYAKRQLATDRNQMLELSIW